MAKMEVTDPSGVEWSVHRRGCYDPSFLDSSGLTGEDALFGLLLLPFILVATWPLWFIAHWLGVRWVIVIERDGIQVGEERVSGLDKSQRRIQEIVESVGAGTWRASDMTG